MIKELKLKKNTITVTECVKTDVTILSYLKSPGY